MARWVTPRHIGLFCGMILYRSRPEFVHRDRSKESSSARLFLFALYPHEYKVIRGLVGTTGSAKHPEGMRDQIHSKSFRDFLVMACSYWPDTGNVRFPGNLHNRELRSSLMKACLRADGGKEGMACREFSRVISEAGKHGAGMIRARWLVGQSQRPAGTGWLYYAAEPGDDKGKIGFTESPANRVPEVARTAGKPGLRMVCKIRGTRAMESWMHRELAAHQVPGPARSNEWFALAPSKTFFKTIKKVLS
jgi:hypothetical protein